MQRSSCFGIFYGYAFLYSLQAHLQLRLRFIVLATISFINDSALRALYKTNFSFPPKTHSFSMFISFQYSAFREPLHLVVNGLQLAGVVIKLCCLFSFIARFNMIAFIRKVYLSKLDQLYQRKWDFNILWDL